MSAPGQGEHFGTWNLICGSLAVALPSSAGHIPCIYISGVHMVTHPPWGQNLTSSPQLKKFGFRRINPVLLSTPPPKSESSYAGNGCQDLPGA